MPLSGVISTLLLAALLDPGAATAQRLPINPVERQFKNASLIACGAPREERRSHSDEVFTVQIFDNRVARRNRRAVPGSSSASGAASHDPSGSHEPRGGDAVRRSTAPRRMPGCREGGNYPSPLPIFREDLPEFPASGDLGLTVLHSLGLQIARDLRCLDFVLEEGITMEHVM